MNPVEIEYEVVDREQTRLGELLLRRYRASTGEHGYELLLDDSFMMASHGAHSETVMAGIAHSRLELQRNLAVLVGGLGAGHTLRAALDLPGVERVDVAEIGARVVDWNRRFFAAVNGAAVDDPRVQVRVGDVLYIVRGAPATYHLILLDVDNGPGWLAAPENATLYEAPGLLLCRSALRPGGVMAVWSPRPNPVFRRSLGGVFEWVEEVDTTTVGDPDGEPASTVYVAG